MSGILILTAVELEARALARELELGALPSLPFPAFARGILRLAPIGLGARLLPERGARLLEGLERPLVVSAGVCAGLDPVLRAGDLILPGSVLGPSGDLHNVTSAQHRMVSTLGASTGPMVTIRKVATTPGAKAALLARTGAVGADMESAFILGWAAASGCPSLVVRAISDDADQELSQELVGLVTPEGKLRLARALALGVTRPMVMPRAFAFKHATRKALRAVARVLATLAG